MWRMKDPADIEKMLTKLRENLEELEVPFFALGINIVDVTTRPPSVRSHNLNREGGGWAPVKDRGREIVVGIWREGRTAYRPDLQAADVYQERKSLEESFGVTVRSVVDIPFTNGTVAFNSTEPEAFSDEDIALMEDLTGVLAEGMQRWEDLRELTRQKEMLEEKNRLLNAFFRIGQRTLFPLNMDQVLDNLAVQVIKAGIFRSLMIALVNEAARTVEVVRSYHCVNTKGAITPGRAIHSDNGCEIVGLTFSLDDEKDLTVRTARSGELLVCEGWGPKLTGKPEKSDEAYKVAYFIPVKKGDRVLAVLATGSTPEEKEVMLRRIEAMQPLLNEITIALDHTHLYRTLGKERERLAVTLRSIGDGVITTDSQGRVTLLNKVAENLTGWKQEEAVGQDLKAVFRCFREHMGEPAEDPVENLRQSDEASGPSQRFLLVSRDASERLIRYSSAPIRDDDDQIIGRVLVVRDITQEQRMEEELNKAQRIESLGLLAGGIAHDFNNILASMLVNVSVMRSQVRQGSELLPIVEDIETSMGQARDLTQQLLTFTKGTEPVRAAASLANLIEDSATFILRGSNVRCECDIPEDLWAVDVDPVQISQVIHNLIINANQAMPEGGTVRISLENVAIGPDDLTPLEEGRYIRCCIADEGSGIPAEHLDQIFDPYFTTKEHGTGLGLPSSFSIIRNHRGWITAESEVGAGSKFFFYLPVAEAQVAQVQAREDGVPRGKGRVLLMDDDDQLRGAVARALGDLGYDMEYAHSGAEAVELYRKRREEGKGFDVVVLDLTVPGGMGAKEAAAELLAFDPQVRVVVSSGYTRDPVMGNFQDYGFLDKIVKPYTAEDLGRVLGRVLNLVEA